MDINKYIAELNAENTYLEWAGREAIPSSGGKPAQIAYSYGDYASKITSLYDLSSLDETNLTSEWTKINTAISETKVTEATISSIFRVAAQIVSQEDKTKKLLSAISPKPRTEVTIKTSGLDNGVLAVGSSMTAVNDINVLPQMPPPTNTGGSPQSSDAAISAPFMCMGLLRLSVKPVESYMRALPSLRTSYGRFYGKQSSLVNNFSPPIAALHQIVVGLDTYTTAQHTLSWMLGQAETLIAHNLKDHGFMRFLIYQHAEMRGMQIYRMVLTALVGLPAITPAQFLRAIEIPDAAEAIKTVVSIATTLDNPETANQDYYWKYAKYVEQAYFVNLSVARNRKFAYLLACILEKEGLTSGAEYASPKKIKALEPIKNKPELAAYYERLADNFHMIYEGIATSKGTGIGVAMRMMTGQTLKRPNPEEPNTQAKRTPQVQQNPSSSGQVITDMDTDERPNTNPPPAKPADPNSAVALALKQGNLSGI